MNSLFIAKVLVFTSVAQTLLLFLSRSCILLIMLVWSTSIISAFCAISLACNASKYPFVPSILFPYVES